MLHVFEFTGSSVARWQVCMSSIPPVPWWARLESAVVVVLLRRNACGRLASHRVKFIDPAMVGLPTRGGGHPLTERSNYQIVDRKVMVWSGCRCDHQ